MEMEKHDTTKDDIISDCVNPRANEIKPSIISIGF